MNYLEYEKNIYVRIALHLTDNETIKFDTFSPTAYYLEQGCKHFGIPEKTMIVFKPRIIHDTQFKLEMKMNDEKKINKLLLIHCEVYNNVKIISKKGNMTTTTYYDFIKRIENNTLHELFES